MSFCANLSNDPSLTVFCFVTGGWIVSLCLHEIGHAVVAYWEGDRDVANKGYFTLNPLKYTHGLLSIVLPMVFLAIGGIGLPGGAVYIDIEAIRSKFMRSLMSAAGPTATVMCTIVLLVPFNTGLVSVDVSNHSEFWAGLSLLAFLQITALLFNLLPIPGLDGFGIIEPILPNILLKLTRYMGSFIFIIIFLFLLFLDTPIRQEFWSRIWSISSQVNLDFELVTAGLRLYNFWST